MEKNSIWIAIVVGLVLLAAILTCPGKDSHKEAIYAESQKMMHSMAHGSSFEEDAVLHLIMDPLTDYWLDEALEVKDYFILSIGTLPSKKSGERERASIGVFGHVFVLDIFD